MTMRISSYTLTPPDAPEPRMRECPECSGHALSMFRLFPRYTCPTCNGTGEVEDDRPAPDRQDIEYEKARARGWED